MRVMIISTRKPSSVHRDYYNIRFLDLDCDDDGIYLKPGSYWTFGTPTPVDQLPQGDEEPNPEEKHSAVLAPPSQNFLQLLRLAEWRHSQIFMILCQVLLQLGNSLVLRS